MKDEGSLRRKKCTPNMHGVLHSITVGSPERLEWQGPEEE